MHINKLANRSSLLLKSSFLIFIAVTLSACGPTIYQSPQKQLIGDERKAVLTAKTPEGKTTLYIVDTGVNEVLGQNKIGGKLISKVDFGFVRLDLIPGNYSVSSGYAGRNNKNTSHVPVTLSLKAGKTYYKTFGWQKKGNKTHTKIYDFSKRTNELAYMPMHVSATPASELYPIDIETALDSCISSKMIAECTDLQAQSTYSFLKTSDKNQVESIIAEDERKKAQMRALEESLPPSLRRDKYMLQLSKLLKDKNYEKALPVFEKLESLGLPLDPSFGYFRGESHLNLGQKTEALKYLYDYIRNQGSAAKYYKKALELINQAEGN